MTSPNITDLGSDVTTPTGEGEYDDSFTEDESESPTTLLDSRLFMVLGHDLELAARLIPRIHALIQYSFASEDSAVRVVPSQGPGETTQTSPSSVGGNAVTASSSVKRTDLQHRKHKRISDEEDEARRNGGPKRPRKKFGPNSPRPPGFACPFFKKDPEKYAAGIDRKYRTCSGPRSHELRRIKYVLYQT
jgi:hypothetical protein